MEYADLQHAAYPHVLTRHAATILLVAQHPLAEYLEPAARQYSWPDCNQSHEIRLPAVASEILPRIRRLHRANAEFGAVHVHGRLSPIMRWLPDQK